MLSTTLRLLMTTLLASSSVAVPQQNRSYFSYPPAPHGELLVSRPELSWSVWGLKNLKVATVAMSLDGEKLDAKYDLGSQSVRARLSGELLEGRHAATCTVTFDTGDEAERSWSFVVLPKALAVLPDSAPDQVLIQHRVDQLRRHHGLRPVTVNKAMNAAAQSHADYMDANKTAGHKERAGNPGFTGTTPGRRAGAYGFFGRNSEAVASSQLDPASAVERLFDAPYHRVMFLQPGNPEFGSGYANGSACLKFGGEQDDAVVVSPPQNGADVPTAWNGIETPDPLRKTNASGPTGYPVVLAVFGEHAETVRLKHAQITDGKNPLDLLKLHPGNDDKLKSAIVLIPRSPLRPRTKYHVSIEYMLDGQSVHRDWSFATAR